MIMDMINDNGQMLVGYSRRRQMYIINTWLTRDRRRRYTWTEPGDTGSYQIDHILTKCRYWNSVYNAKAYPGADIDSDHNLVVDNLRVQLSTKATVRQRSNEGTAVI